MNHLFAHVRAVRLAELVSTERRFYERSWTPAAIRRWQLAALNREWARVRERVPYYARLVSDGSLPARFESWDEFRSDVPAVDRETVQHHLSSMTCGGTSVRLWRATGGATGQPLRIPVSPSEKRISAADLWLGRSWNGIAPADRLFLLWGHAHALGVGVNGWISRVTRRLCDRLLGYSRWSAYDLSDEAMQRAALALLRVRPVYVVGYAVALDRFARVNRVLRGAFHGLRLKATIATAESFPRSDSRAVIEDVLGCPVFMEYGAVETGPIAYERSLGGFHVFWRHYFVEGEPSLQIPGTFELLVTSLFPRCLPLVRYRTGDLAAADPNSEGFDQCFERIIGRCNDYVLLEDGRAIHSEAFSHAVRESPILAFQVVQDEARAITLRYVTEHALSVQDVAIIRRRLAHLDPGLAGVAFQRTQQLDTTVAGKTRRVTRVSPAEGEVVV